MKSDIKEAIDKAGIEDKKVVEKLLRIHGQDVPDSNLSGALDLLAEIYDVSVDNLGSVKTDIGRHNSPKRAVATLSKKTVVNYIRKKAREARSKRIKSRSSTARDRFDGRIAALDDILRYLKKR